MAMRIEPEISGVSIVLVGNLNPAIFNPDWFARHGLLSADEAESSDIAVIHPEITSFRSEWLNIRVEQQRFCVESAEAPFIRLCDLTVRTFREFLSHTPIGRMGINRHVHFDVGTIDGRDRIGNRLAPKDAWGDWAPCISAGHGGMRSLTMEQTHVEGRANGYIRAKVEPSVRLRDPRTGVFVEINDHYEVDDPDKVKGCDGIIALLEDCFEESLHRSEWIVDQIMRLTDG